MASGLAMGDAPGWLVQNDSAPLFHDVFCDSTERHGQDVALLQKDDNLDYVMGSSFLKSNVLENGTSFYSADILDQAAVGSEPASSVSCFRSGQGVEFSQEVVVRGSLSSLKSFSLPSIKRFRLWGNAYWGNGDVTPSGQSLKLDHSSNGAMIGVTLPISCCTLSGYYNYNNSNLTATARDREQTTHLGGLGLYFNTGGVYLTLLGNGGMDSYSFDRNAGDVGLDFDGYQLSGSVEIGCEMNTKSLFVLKPFTMLQYSRLWHDDYNLATGTVLDDSRKYNAMYSVSGAKVDVKLGSSDFLTCQGRFAWVYQMLSENAPMSTYWFGRISGTATPAQLFYEGNLASSAFWVGVGAKVSCFSKISITVDYDVLTNKNQTNNLLSVGALLSW
ncbi:MAG: autotransporter outer membrane beta-barrel domain-containing protein [Thermoguttaceae bacterium]|nr:autotransporter outer membrane beta-barrel domain-containing protein [Thermoguttaceae bacterium]